MDKPIWSLSIKKAEVERISEQTINDPSLQREIAPESDIHREVQERLWDYARRQIELKARREPEMTATLLNFRWSNTGQEWQAELKGGYHTLQLRIQEDGSCLAEYFPIQQG